MSPASKWRQRLSAVGFMFAVTLVFVTGVSVLHLATRSRVRRNESLFLQRALMAAATGTADADAAGVRQWFASCVQPHPDAANPMAFTVREAAGGQVNCRAWIRGGAGLWGRVSAVVALEPDLRTVRGVAILEQNETPGLGARITETWFTGQFRGKTGPLRRVPEKTRSGAPGEFDGITGATITTDAVRDIVNGVLAGAQAAGAAPGQGTSP